MFHIRKSGARAFEASGPGRIQFGGDLGALSLVYLVDTFKDKGPRITMRDLKFTIADLELSSTEELE